MRLSKGDVGRGDFGSGQYPSHALPWKFVRIIAMHWKHDRRNTDETVWLDDHVLLHAREAGGLPAVSPGLVPVADLVTRFEGGESSAEIASASKLDANAVASALSWAQKTSMTKAPWRKRTTRISKAGATKTRADLHGQLLVEAVMAWAKERKFRARGKLTAAEIRKLRLAGRRRLPPSLATWLAYDSSKLSCGKKLTATNLAGVSASLRERLASPRLEKQLAGACYLLDVGDRQATFLYADSATPSDGEYPVLTLDVDGAAEATLVAPGFDVYIATKTGFFEEPAVLGAVPKAYDARMKAQAKRGIGR